MGIPSTHIQDRTVGNSLAAVLMTCIAATACSSGPAAPSAISGPASVSAGMTALEPAASKGVVSFPMLGGIFTFTFSNGDSISGAYTGEASVSNPGADVAVLNLTVTGGTGAFAGASASLTGSGRGAFSGEGDFSLSVKGSLSTNAAPKALSFAAQIKGESVASCGEQRIALTLNGDGAAPKLGSVVATLRHEVGNTGCFP